jgi:hypothetical protein
MRRYNPYRDSPYAGMSPEDIEEMFEKRRNLAMQRELKEEFDWECRRDEEVINNMTKREEP